MKVSGGRELARILLLADFGRVVSGCHPLAVKGFHSDGIKQANIAHPFFFLRDSLYFSAPVSVEDSISLLPLPGRRDLLVWPAAGRTEVTLYT